MSAAGLTLREGGVRGTVEWLLSGGDTGGRTGPGRRGRLLVVGPADRLHDRLVGAGVPADAVAVTRFESWAREAVAASRGEPVRTLDPVTRAAAVGDALRAVHEGPVARLADRVAGGGDPDPEAVAAELEDYHRCTDAAADHETLLSAVERVAGERPFAADVTRESVRAFRALDGRLRRTVGEGDADAAGRTFVSRSHLLRAAREDGETALDDAAVASRAHDWTLVVPREPADAAVLRTVVALAEREPVTLLTGPGDDRLTERALAVAGEAGVAARTAAGDGPGADPARRVLAAARNRPTTAPSGVDVVAAPDRRREVERAVRVAADAAGRTLLVAPDPAAYAPALREVTLTADRPHRVGTPRRVGTLPAARTLRAVTTLVAAVAAAETVPAAAVADPLRLGAVPPTADAGDWPLDLAAVERLRSALPETGSLDAHRMAVADADASGGEDGEDPSSRTLAFLDWVAAAAAEPPADGRALSEWLVGACAAHGRALRDERGRRIAGIAVETDRARATAAHPASAAATVRTAVEEQVGPAYDRLTDDGEDWSAARTALRAALSAERHPPATDADALELLPVADPAVGAARVDHLVVLGLSAGQFPRTPPRPTLLHRAVREAVARGAAGPAAHLDGEATRYRADLDALGRTLRAVAADGRVTLSRPYKDDEGRDVPPSPFLDALSVPAERRDRIGLDQWVADPETAATAPPKERLRTLARRAGAGGEDRAALDRLAERTDGTDARRLSRRVERFEERLGATENER